MIGTGPFKLSEYKQNERTVVTRNPDYWQKGYPKAKQITFVPGPRERGAGEPAPGRPARHHAHRQRRRDRHLRAARRARSSCSRRSPASARSDYYFLLSDKPPFNDPDARKAFATALDRNKINQIRNKGLFDLANGLMDVRAPGYVKNAGYPAYNPKEARKLVAQVQGRRRRSFHVILGTHDRPREHARGCSS